MSVIFFLPLYFYDYYVPTTHSSNLVNSYLIWFHFLSVSFTWWNRYDYYVTTIHSSNLDLDSLGFSPWFFQCFNLTFSIICFYDYYVAYLIEIPRTSYKNFSSFSRSLKMIFLTFYYLTHYNFLGNDSITVLKVFIHCTPTVCLQNSKNFV